MTTRASAHPLTLATRAALLLTLLLTTTSSRALAPDDLLLLTNANVPQGQKLAQLYAEKRNVPADRILSLDLPTAEEMSADDYDRKVIPAVREFLRTHHLELKVRCAVTFFGVPLRIANRQLTQADKDEQAALLRELNVLPSQVEPIVGELEHLAKQLDPAFAPKSNATDLDNQARRAEAAIRAIGPRTNAIADPAERQRVQRDSIIALGKLVGPAGLIERRLISATRPATTQSATTQPTSQPAPTIDEQLARFRAEMIRLQDHRYDPAARQQQRALARADTGALGYARVLQSHLNAFQTDNTAAAFDSELALLWWDYPRTMWIANPLFYASQVQAQHLPTPPVLMTMRLDGATAGVVSQIILASLKAEADGLTGRVVVDSRGLPPTANGKPDAFGQYDQTLRNLADLVRTKTKLPLTFDDRPDVLPANSVRDVACYMGWYSVDKYVPACEFHPGAVAWHLASFTMITLRREDPRCWARELLNDGAAATLGAVNEPYLGAFPRADDFFPLLLTGKLPLAEVYWRTTPMASWQICFIGDPLYTPYKANPALAPQDLPDRLKPLLTADNPK